MTADATEHSLSCQGCGAALEVSANGPVACGNCQWRGSVYFLQPIAPDTRPAEPATEDDARCAYHPGKKAVAICAGTGDFICSLCAIDFGGKIYGANYFENAGAAKLAETYKTILKRPDYWMKLYLISLAIPGINYFTALGFPLLAGHSFLILAKMKKMCKEDPLYAAVITSDTCRNYAILLAILLMIWLIGIVRYLSSNTLRGII